MVFCFPIITFPSFPMEGSQRAGRKQEPAVVVGYFLPSGFCPHDMGLQASSCTLLTAACLQAHYHVWRCFVFVEHFYNCIIEFTLINCVKKKPQNNYCYATKSQLLTDKRFSESVKTFVRYLRIVKLAQLFYQEFRRSLKHSIVRNVISFIRYEAFQIFFNFQNKLPN